MFKIYTYFFKALIRASRLIMDLFISSKLRAKLSCTPCKSALLLSIFPDISACTASTCANVLVNSVAANKKRIY